MKYSESNIAVRIPRYDVLNSSYTFVRLGAFFTYYLMLLVLPSAMLLVLPSVMP
jgi:hypothetical protein